MTKRPPISRMSIDTIFAHMQIALLKHEKYRHERELLRVCAEEAYRLARMETEK